MTTSAPAAAPEHLGTIAHCPLCVPAWHVLRLHAALCVFCDGNAGSVNIARDVCTAGRRLQDEMLAGRRLHPLDGRPA